MKTLISGVFLVCVLLLSALPAHAYLDPGTGSMVIQAILAGIAAVSVTFLAFWKRLKEFFRRVFKVEKREKN